jgi:hypothetical protein
MVDGPSPLRGSVRRDVHSSGPPSGRPSRDDRFWRARSFWIAGGSVAYVAFAALRASAAAPLSGAAAVAALALLPSALAVVWWATSDERPARGVHVDPAARTAARACAAGVAVLLASRTGPVGPAFTAFGALGAAIASMASLVALARIAPPGGLVEPPRAARSLDAAALSSLLWSVAVALPAVVALAPERAQGIDPFAMDAAVVAASVGSLGVQIASAARVRGLRRLEPGVADRAWAALCLSGAALSIGVGAAVVGVLSPDRVLPIACASSSAAIVLSMVDTEPTSVSRGLRTTLSVAALCAPVALFAVFVATQGSPAHAGAVVFAACTATALGGLAAPLIARWFAPEAARWLKAFEAATRAAMNPDPESALEAALTELRDASGRIFRTRPWGVPAPRRGRTARRSRRTIPAVAPHDPSAAPQGAAVYRLVPGDMVCVDRAGYVQLQSAVVPPHLIELARREPERVLVTEAARWVEVRRPDVRSVVAWMDQRGIAVAAVLFDDMGPMGLLTVPRGARTSPPTLEELRALRLLADRLGAVLGVSAMLTRSRQRELEARAEIEVLKKSAANLSRDISTQTIRMESLARALERPARTAVYGPAARVAVQELERLAATGRPLTLLTPPGTNAVAWSALVHLASPRHAGVLVIVDGTNGREHHLSRWREDDGSPLRVAAGGTLVILDAQALPIEVQSYIGVALPEDVGISVTVPSAIEGLVAAGRIDERLANRMGDHAVPVPALAARGEDLRALALDHLVRIGQRLHGRSLGLDNAALAQLQEHGWPGNDVELEAVLLRAAIATEVDVIGAAELAASGFVPVPVKRDPIAPPIPITRRRRR